MLAGCGGGNDTSTTMSKAQVIKQGDMICRRASNEKSTAFRSYMRNHPAALKTQQGQRQVVVAAVLPAIEEELEGLQKLTPASDADSYRAILSALEAGIPAADAEPRNLTKANTPLRKANQLARQYGFKVCSYF
jgi:hypothetical protein